MGGGGVWSGVRSGGGRGGGADSVSGLMSGPVGGGRVPYIFKFSKKKSEKNFGRGRGRYASCGLAGGLSCCYIIGK